jgi:hypothetical protein
MHGLLEGQCSICEKLRENLQSENLKKETDKPSNTNIKKAKG